MACDTICDVELVPWSWVSRRHMDDADLLPSGAVGEWACIPWDMGSNEEPWQGV